MNFTEARYLIRSDLHRYARKSDIFALVKVFLTTPGYRYSFFMRLCHYLKSKTITRYSIFPFIWLMYRHYMIKYGIIIPYETKIDSGFYIGYWGGIVVTHLAKIGKNCNISPNVNIGRANRGKRKGYPTIGDNVYLAPGAKIVGNVKIGNNVAIGANCVVVDDVPDNAVVVGVPGKVISYKGSEGYINNTNY